MIVRILGEGQYSLSDRQLARLNAIDARLTQALETDDRVGFGADFSELIGFVRLHGGVLEPDHLAPSDIVLPAADSTFDEVRLMVRDDGLLPG